MTRSAWQRSQKRPSLIGCASLPKPTIAPVQIEQTSTGVIVAPVRGRIANSQRGKATDRQAVVSFGVGAMLGGKSVKHGKDRATDRMIG
jgi:hypothetical protein